MNVFELTCAEYLARRRPASQPLSHTRSCLACSSSLFSRIRDSLASLIFLSLSARRRSISLRRFLFASVASRSFSFLATRRNSSSCGRHGNKLIITHSVNKCDVNKWNVPTDFTDLYLYIYMLYIFYILFVFFPHILPSFTALNCFVHYFTHKLNIKHKLN